MGTPLTLVMFSQRILYRIINHNFYKMAKFVISIQGEHVWHNCQMECIISDTTDETLEKVRKHLSKKYNLEIGEFKIHNGLMKAYTSDKDVEVFLDEVKEL